MTGSVKKAEPVGFGVQRLQDPDSTTTGWVEVVAHDWKGNRLGSVRVQVPLDGSHAFADHVEVPEGRKYNYVPRGRVVGTHDVTSRRRSRA